MRPEATLGISGWPGLQGDIEDFGLDFLGRVKPLNGVAQGSKTIRSLVEND